MQNNEYLYMALNRDKLYGLEPISAERKREIRTKLNSDVLNPILFDTVKMHSDTSFTRLLKIRANSIKEAHKIADKVLNMYGNEHEAERYAFSPTGLELSYEASLHEAMPNIYIVSQYTYIDC